jgi:hypothetical protein
MQKEISEKVYTIDDHPNPKAVYDWVRNNWHDLGEHIVHEMVDSLKALADHVGGTLDYSFGLFPDRGEFVRITGGNRSWLKGVKSREYPLAGVCWDQDVIGGYRDGNLERRVLSALHSEGEYRYSDKGIHEYIECNGDYFKLNGEFYQ